MQGSARAERRNAINPEVVAGLSEGLAAAEADGSIAVVVLMTLGLLDLARPLNPDDWSPRHVWAMMPALYFLGLARARRRYQ